MTPDSKPSLLNGKEVGHSTSILSVTGPSLIQSCS